MRTTLKIRNYKKKTKNQRKIKLTKLKITTEGGIYILLTLGVGFAAINTGNNMLFLVLGFMLSLIILSGIVSEINLWGLEVKRTLPDLPWAGEVSGVEIAVHNRKRFSSFCVEIQDVASNFTVDRRCFFLRINGKKTQSTAYHCIFPRRGIVNFTQIVVITKFPFGFFSKSFKIDYPDELIVAPRKVLTNADVPDSVLSGELLTREKIDPRDLEIFNIRPYRPGDDQHRINWKLSARHDRLLVNEGIDRRKMHVNIIFDDILISEENALKLESLRSTLPGKNEKNKENLSEEFFEDQVNLAASTVHDLAMKGFSLWFGSRRKTIGPLIPEQAKLIIIHLATISPIKIKNPPPLPNSPPGPTIYFNRSDFTSSVNMEHKIYFAPERLFHAI
jgi:hypothetical protein